jgi:diacylglycerol kinase (ATP)
VKIWMVINPRTPEVVEELRRCVEKLRSEGHVVEPRLTFEKSDAKRFASDAAAGGAELVIAAGGDGTLNEVVDGLVVEAAGGGGEGGARVLPRVAVLPLGTANDLATALGIPGEAGSALEVALAGERLRTNVGVVNGRHFLNVSTGGFGAEATQSAAARAKRVLGTAAYLVEGIRQFATLTPAEAVFEWDGGGFEGAFLLFAVGNYRVTGGGNRITPEAELGDGLLDLCIVPELSRMEFLSLAPQLRAGEHVDNPAIVYRQVRYVVVRAATELCVNVDGEPLRGREFRYAVSPVSLTLMVPPRGMQEGEG